MPNLKRRVGINLLAFGLSRTDMIFIRRNTELFYQRVLPAIPNSEFRIRGLCLFLLASHLDEKKCKEENDKHKGKYNVNLLYKASNYKADK